MKQFRFILLCATIAVMAAGITGCKKGVYDEQAALTAQKDLLQFKYDQEIKLEMLRQSGQTASTTLQYNFSIKTTLFNDSLSKANATIAQDASLRKRPISIKVTDYITSAPVIGAEVTIPTIVGTVIKATTDSTGYANFSPNINIPYPASAIATKDGYASGSVLGTINGGSSASGTGTINIWNTKNANNTVNGKVYIENDLTNDVAEVAKKAFINAFTTVNLNGYTQRFDFTATTDDNGNYSMKVPDLSGSLYFAHSAIEGTSKMYVQGLVPGEDSIPSLQSIPATYYLGDGSSSYVNRTKGSGFNLNPYSSYIEFPSNSLINNVGTGYTIPYSIQRYHVSAPADSNKRAHYIKNLSFTRSVLATSQTVDSAYLASPGSYTSYTASTVLSAVKYSSNINSSSAGYPSRYVAGTKVKDTVNATLYDVLANADGYWITAPTLKFELTTDSTTTPGNKFKYISKLIQTTGGKITKDDVNSTYDITLYNKIKTYSPISSSGYDGRTINSAIVTISNIKSGKTYNYDLTFGAGKLNSVVR